MRPIAILALLTALSSGAPPIPRPGAQPTPTAGLGPVTAWVWQFDPRMGGDALPTYRGLLGAIPRDVPILVGVELLHDVRLFEGLVGTELLADRPVEYLEVGKRLSGWARDRFVLFRRQDTVVALLPAEDRVAPERRGDLAFARALRAWDASIEIAESRLAFEGGNVLVTPQHVLVGAGAVAENVERFDGDADAVRAAFEEEFDRSLVVVGEHDRDLPHEHVDMYLTAAGSRLLLLGDPSLGLGAFGDDGRLAVPEAGLGTMGSFSRSTQEQWVPFYEAIAEHLRAEGFVVERLPILHTDEGALVTWNNAVLERRGSRPRAYVPHYGIRALDREAERRFRLLGFEVLPVDAALLIAQGGAVRCLSNTLP